MEPEPVARSMSYSAANAKFSPRPGTDTTGTAKPYVKFWTLTVSNCRLDMLGTAGNRPGRPEPLAPMEPKNAKHTNSAIRSSPRMRNQVFTVIAWMYFRPTYTEKRMLRTAPPGLRPRNRSGVTGEREWPGNSSLNKKNDGIYTRYAFCVMT